MLVHKVEDEPGGSAVGAPGSFARIAAPRASRRRPGRRGDQSSGSGSAAAYQQRRERYVSPPNGFIIALSLFSARTMDAQGRCFPSCCS
jgi:hypothetical protein